MEKSKGPQPLVEVYGDRRVLVEHHSGVLENSGEAVTVKARFGLIRVRGEKLCFARMTGEQLVICGRIGGVELIRGGSHG